MSSWEVFDVRNGTPVRAVPWRWVAAWLCRRDDWLDYARTGDGWA